MEIYVEHRGRDRDGVTERYLMDFAKRYIVLTIEVGGVLYFYHTFIVFVFNNYQYFKMLRILALLYNQLR